MKKFISVLILLAFLSVAAFAEFFANFELDITQNLLSVTAPLSDDADTANPNNRAPGSLDFFTHNRNDMRQSEMFLRLNFVREHFNARLEFTGHSLINSRDRGLREGYSFLSLFDELLVGDFWIRGNLGIIHAAYGRFHSRGVMNENDFRFDTGTWWDLRYTGAGGGLLGPYRFFGFQMPGFRYTEVNNHSAIHGGEHYMLVGAAHNFGFGDLGLELSGGRSENRASDHGSAIGLGVRASGVNIANLITVEAMYGVTGRDPTRDETDGRGRWEHRFGVYGGLNLLGDSLGLSFGYSGGFISFENWEGYSGTAASPIYPPINLQRIGPFFNAIDLKAQFTGHDRFTLTAAVNASFASVSGSNNDRTRHMSLGILPTGGALPGGALGANQEESFVGLAVGVIADFEITDNLNLALQIKNSTQWENFNDGADWYIDQTSNKLGVALTARFAITSNFSIMSGLAMQMDTVSQSGARTGTAISYSGGDLYFGIPITLHITF